VVSDLDRFRDALEQAHCTREFSENISTRIKVLSADAEMVSSSSSSIRSPAWRRLAGTHRILHVS
jgi:hypothetical protein